MTRIDRLPGVDTRTRRAFGGLGSDFVPYTGAIKDIDLGSFNLTTTGLITAGNLDVDTLNFNANVISDSTGTISFDGDNLASVGTITLTANDDVILSGTGHVTSGSEGFIVGSLTITDGSIDDTDGTINFGDTNLTAIGTLSCGVPTFTVEDESSDTTCFPLFATAATGGISPKTGSNLLFNSATGLFTVTSLKATGLISGRVPYISTGGLIASDSELLWDSSNHILSSGRFNAGRSSAGMPGFVCYGGVPNILFQTNPGAGGIAISVIRGIAVNTDNETAQIGAIGFFADYNEGEEPAEAPIPIYMFFDSTTTGDYRHRMLTIDALGRVGVGHLSTRRAAALFEIEGNANVALSGTVAATNGSNAVVGTSTNFDNGEISVGDAIRIESSSGLGWETFIVSAIADDTNLTLNSNYTGTTDSGLSAWTDQDLFEIANADSANYVTVNKSGDWLISTDKKIQFRDTAIGIYSQANTFMDLFADGAVRIGDSSGGAPTNYSKFEPDGTLEFNGTATVFKDINMGAATLARPAASQPDEVNFLDEGGGDTGITTLAYAIGEKASGSVEIDHDYKEGSDITFHVHWQGIAAPSGTDNVQWRLTYVLMRSGTTLDAATTIDTVDTAIDTRYKSYRSDFVVIDGATKGNNGGSIIIEDQFIFTLERVTATGDAYAGDALVATVGLHYEIDTVGSRQILTK